MRNYLSNPLALSSVHKLATWALQEQRGTKEHSVL